LSEKWDTLIKQGYFVSLGKKIFFPVERIYLECFPKRKVFKEHNEKKRWIWVYPENLENTQYEKLDPNVYYEHGAVYSNNKKGGPIKKGFKKARKSFPSQEKTSPILGKITHMENTNPTVFAGDNEIFFDKTQILLLKIIFHSYQGFSQVLDKEKLKNIGFVKSLQKQIKEANQFLVFYQDMEDVLDQLDTERDEKIKEIFREYPNDTATDRGNRRQEYREALKWFYEKYKPKMENIFQKHSFSRNDFCAWRDTLGTHSFMKAMSFYIPFCRSYIRGIRESDFANGEYINYMIARMNFAWTIITGEELSVSQSLLKISEYRLCEICQVRFKPRNTNQYSCGSKYCQKLYKTRCK
jgi:hypothetical protein